MGERDSGATHRGVKRERGQSQSQWEGDEERVEGAAKRMCGGGSGLDPDTSEGEDDGEGGKWEDGWVKQEMEGLEERGRGLSCRGEGELFWWGGGEALRRKR